MTIFAAVSTFRSLKKIDKLISSSFIGPAILSYFVATFVLVMQFLWKYIDDILGRGFTILQMLELIFYYAVTLIPMAVPITVLISSVMVFGDMAEKYELSSMKSAGISLFRIMRPSMIVAFSIGLFSLFASNYLKPAANLQFQKRFLMLSKQNSALSIEQGIFNDDFPETVIRVNQIDENGKDIHDVLIYDHSQNDKSLVSMTSAKSGQMFTAEEGKYFVMKLDTGVQYRELEKKSRSGSGHRDLPFMRTYYDQWIKSFDMSQFGAEEGLLNINRNKEDMMNTFQLVSSIDTFQANLNRNNEKIETRIKSIFTTSNIAPRVHSSQKNLPDSIKVKMDSIKISNNQNFTKKDSTSTNKVNNLPVKPLKLPSPINIVQNKTKKIIQKNKNIRNTNTSSKIPIIHTPIIPTKKLITFGKKVSLDTAKYIVEAIDSIYFRDVIVRAMSDLTRDRDELLTNKNINYDYYRSTEKYLLRLNQQYSWGAICVIFLFIGAPLGSIIRKGGYGYPLLVAILFYMIFIITTILGEKLVRNETIGGVYAAWLPCLVLSPFALFLTILASRDTKFNPGAIVDLIRYKWSKNKLKSVATSTEDLAEMK